jgi:hypothetical protein
MKIFPLGLSAELRICSPTPYTYVRWGYGRRLIRQCGNTLILQLYLRPVPEK